jgi:arylsulfatase A-like enzyme
MKTFSLSFFSLFIVISGWSEDRPNIIILLADDLGWADLGYQGSEDIRSPHIDKLANNGIRFTDGHVSASVCSPSRAGLMTGRYQQRFGHEANSPPPTDGMDLKQLTMADRLKKLGYRTGLIGKWHLGNQDEFYPTQRGFDYFYGLRSGSRSYFYNAQKDDKAGNAKAIEENGNGSNSMAT